MVVDSNIGRYFTALYLLNPGQVERFTFLIALSKSDVIGMDMIFYKPPKFSRLSYKIEVI